MAGLFDASEMNEVVREIKATAATNARKQVTVLRSTAREGAVMTRKSARGTARRWGKDYPPAIRDSRLSALAYVIQPEGKAADWSFEEGSKNQPAHRNFAGTADVLETRLPFRAQAAMEDSFPESWQ